MLVTYSKATKTVASLDSQMKVVATDSHAVERSFGDDVLGIAQYDTEAKAVTALEKVVKHFDDSEFDAVIYLDSDPIA